MSLATVRPGRIEGSIQAPPSKSYTHRALVVGHLTRRRFSVVRPLDADDTRATARAIDALGSRVSRARGVWRIVPDRGTVPRRRSIDCGESGTTLRFIAALAARSGTRTVLRGRGRLPERPLGELLDALAALGAEVRRPAGRRTLPLTLVGPIHGGSVRLDASQSSQFASALLLTLPTLGEDSELRLTGTIVSEPYLEATIAILRRHGIRLRRWGRHFSIPGRQRYEGQRSRVPGDASSAAYLWAGAAISGGRVRVRGIPPDLPQADLAVLGLLRARGARVEVRSDGAIVASGGPSPFRVDLTACPDLYPLAAVLAATVPGASSLLGAAHVIHKESDRRAEAIRLAAALGASVRPTRSGLRIRGTSAPRGFRLTDLDDHRVVMSAAVGALAAGTPSHIADAGAVRKSFPGFWDALRSLGASVRT
ncbi:MAG TPA: 3-phosphoshikimate 1-carboxyvinyltransferase [Thermoplasmata archaeon]|nr:3-phosphoshikimate 1-carboxyvinyltransferase [Thermoplasmata archaeon]